MRNGNTKRPMIHRLFGTTNSSWSGAVRSCTNSRQVSWLKDLRPPPPSQSNASVAGARSTRAAGSLITVTRSCGICTRFPFTLSRAPEGSAARQTMKGTCCFIFSFRFIVAHCIQKRKVLFVCSAEFFRPSWASLQPPVQNLTQAFPIQRLGGMLVHTGGFGRLHILGKGVGRHGNNGHLRGIGFGQRTDGRRARFCILSVYNFKSLAVGMAVW